MPLLKVDNITCRYDTLPVVEQLSFHVNQGEIVSLLGPSGCGKTTVLRAIAGFEPVHEGTILMRGNTVSAPGFTLPPESRAVGMVFQDYALFPHLSVADNIIFGLRGKKPAERRDTVRRMLAAIGLEGLGGRYPHELSGGQQQRVALARALAPHPALLLLDEPFSNLDVELRERLSIEVRNILKAEGITGILVTHDQHEAFAISDKVGVTHQGRILQWDTPFNLYHEPANRFIADFVGQGVFVRGMLETPDTFRTDLGVLHANRAYQESLGTCVEILLRPDDIVPDPAGPIEGEVIEKAFKGAETLYTLRLESGTRVLALFPSHRDLAPGDRVRVRVAADHLVSFPCDPTGR
jgi:iron(III) transport system ATP-binding protein